MQTQTLAVLPSVRAKVLPPLNPNEPNARIRVPSTTIGMLWPGIGFAEPSLYWPIRGPARGPRPSRHTSGHVDDRQPAKSMWPIARPKV